MEVVTSDERVALGLSQVTFVKRASDLKALGFNTDNGAIKPKRILNGQNITTAPPVLSEGIPPRIGGNFTLDFDPPVIDFEVNTLPALTVSGNLILSGGSPIVLRGLSMASIGNEFNDLGAVYRLNRTIAQFPECNVIRFPCQPSQIAQYGLSNYITYWIDPAVAWCQQNGYYCIIDWHRIDRWDNADTAFKAFWDTVSDRYKNLTHVCYELFNEPTDPNPGGQAGWDAFKVQMQLWVDYIRVRAPNTLLLLSSPFFAQETRWIPNNPVTGTNLAYVHHVYPGHVPGGSVENFQGNPEPDTTLATKIAWMDEAFGDAMETIPVVFTEWGYALTDVGFYLLEAKSRASYADPLIDYFADNGGHWTSWAMDPTNGPAMQNLDESLNDFGQFVSGILT